MECETHHCKKPAIALVTKINGGFASRPFCKDGLAVVMAHQGPNPLKPRYRINMLKD